MTERSKAMRHFNEAPVPTVEDRERLILARKRPWCVVATTRILTLPKGMTPTHFEAVRAVLPKWTPAGATQIEARARVAVVAGVGNRRRRGRARRVARRSVVLGREGIEPHKTRLWLAEWAQRKITRLAGGTPFPMSKGRRRRMRRAMRRLQRSSKGAIPVARALSSPLTSAEAMREAGREMAEGVASGHRTTAQRQRDEAIKLPGIRYFDTEEAKRLRAAVDAKAEEIAALE